jgi:hypothetical protein
VRRFTIETADSRSGKKYRQTFRNNMTVRSVADMLTSHRPHPLSTYQVHTHVRQRCLLTPQ